MSNITDLSNELARLGFTQKHLEMQFPRKGGTTGQISVHQVGGGFRVSFSDWEECNHVTVKKLDLASILAVFPDWVVKKMRKKKDAPRVLFV